MIFHHFTVCLVLAAVTPTMAKPGSITRDLSLLLITISAFALPVLDQRNLVKPAETIRAVLKATGVVVGGMTALVLGGGLVLAAEKVYNQGWGWLWGPQRRDGGHARDNGGADGETGDEAFR